MAPEGTFKCGSLSALDKFIADKMSGRSSAESSANSPYDEGTVSSSLSGPRLSGIESFVKNLGFDCGLTREVFEVDRGWFRVSIRFRFRGQRHQLDQFKAILDASLEAYNAED